MTHTKFRNDTSMCSKFKMADAQNGWHGKFGYGWTRHTAPNLKRPKEFCDFWPNHSQVTSKYMNFSYLLTTRWHNAKTLQVASGHTSYNTNQVWSQNVKQLRRYRYRSIFACIDFIPFGLSQGFRGEKYFHFVPYGSKVNSINMSETLDKWWR